MVAVTQVKRRHQLLLSEVSITSLQSNITHTHTRRVRTIPKKLPSRPILLDPADSIPNANTDISFLPCFLRKLDMRGEVCCASRASPTVLTKH